MFGFPLVTFAFSALKNIYEEVTGYMYNPNILIADGSAAITKGFVDAFGFIVD